MITKKTVTYAHGKNDSKSKDIQFVAITGSFTGKNVDQHVQVSTETKQRAYSNKVDVQTKTHSSYTTHFTLVDENGEDHDYSVPGKDFTCPMNSLVTAMHMGETGNNPCKLMYLKAHKKDQEFNYNTTELHKGVNLKNWSLYLLDRLGVVFAFIGVILSIIGIIAIFNGTLAGLFCFLFLLPPFLLIKPYSKWQNKFDQFCHKESQALMAEIHTKVKASQPTSSNAHLDSLSNINDQQDDVWSKVITEGQES